MPGVIWIRIRVKGETFVLEFFILSMYNFEMQRKMMRVGEMIQSSPSA